MKEKFRQKYIPPFFGQQLVDKWNRLTQENKSVTNYIIKFDKYLNRFSAIELESLYIPYLGSDQVLGMSTTESSQLDIHDLGTCLLTDH